MAITVCERVDTKGNFFKAEITGEALTLKYGPAEAPVYIEKTFNPESNDPKELREGLYRMAKIICWMDIGVYSDFDRVDFISTGGME